MVGVHWTQEVPVAYEVFQVPRPTRTKQFNSLTHQPTHPPAKCRTGLYSKMDALLEERTLLGTSRTCVEGLRSVAYSMLAELVVGARSEMSYPQLQRAVHIFTRWV